MCKPLMPLCMRRAVTAHTGPDTRTKTPDVMGDQGRMVTIRDDGYHSHCMMYSIRPKIPGLPRAVVGRHWQPLAWDVRETGDTPANVTESRDRDSTKTLLHVRDTFRLGRDYRPHECLESNVCRQQCWSLE